MHPPTLPTAARPGAGATAVIEALFCGPQGPPPPERVEWIDRDLADFLHHAGPRPRFLLGLCLWLVEWLAPLFIWRLPRFSRLPLPVRVRALERLEHGPLSLALLGLKAILCFIHYEHPDARREIGVDGACLGTRA